MYQVGDLVVYGISGVYKVESIGVPDMKHIDKEKLYYSLSSIYNGGNIFTPVDTSVPMRSVITYEAIQELIKKMHSIEANIIETPEINTLKEQYQTCIQTGDYMDLLQLIRSIYIKKINVTSQGKNLSQTDLQYMKKAEDILYGEFAIALDIPKEEVKGYIEERVEN